MSIVLVACILAHRLTGADLPQVNFLNHNVDESHRHKIWRIILTPAITSGARLIRAYRESSVIFTLVSSPSNRTNLRRAEIVEISIRCAVKLDSTYDSNCFVERSHTASRNSLGWLAAAAAALAASPAVGVGGGGIGTSYIPTATSFVKSGVIARSVTRMGVRPHESRCFPSASYR